ncbi:hypothetical protein GCM10017714_16290 [Curtobacterium pusillum]|uniref:J domain-containing protein n=1 Tax=Curtobacterium pusillum TaxID=69373 RepID=A0ABX2MGX3_9MICO|nr:hypothetical protein [Curtobacterium pusillum]NUU14524.1 hypothetical protein [Curtobacterium pusillum]GLK30888.1 hypothetical protein GCM10017610_11730 [Curtobacterium pusillum]
MGFLDRLLGRPERDRDGAPQNQWGQPQQQGYRYGQQSYHQPAVGAASTDDERAVERYRYLLRTAPPERIEDVHAEAFATLTPEQRRMVYDEFTRTAPVGEAPRGDDPRSLAQAATRSEIRQPGFMERSLGGVGNGRGGVLGGGFGGAGQRSGPSFGSMIGASILGTVAGYVIGSAIMSAFLPDPGSFDGGTDAAGDGGSEDTGADPGDGGASDGGGFESAGWGDSGSDFGGGFGDFGGDFDV